MRRLLDVLEDPVAWILVIAGVVELISGGTAARGAILFAGAALILTDRIMRDRTLSRRALHIPAVPLQELMERRVWPVVIILAAALSATFAVHTFPLTLVTGLTGVLVVGWAWLTAPDISARLVLPRKGLVVWGGVFLALGLWELTALLGQPTLVQTSTDHPTISFLLDPFVATYPGRAVALALWALAGRGLVRRA
jgi:hypothetical protein